MIIIFITIIWTLSAIALVKFIKILNAIEEIVDVYEKIKMVMGYYEALPWVFMEKIKSFIFRGK